MNQFQKKSHLRRNIAIAAIMVLLFLIIPIAYNFYRQSYEIQYTGTITIPPLSYKYLEIDVPSNAKNIVLRIYFIAQGGTGNDIRCYVMEQTNFINWKNVHQAYFIYDSGQVTTAKDQVILPGSGIYYIVFDNTFSVFSSKIINYTITLSYATTLWEERFQPRLG